MRIALVGADFEENLGVGMIAAAAEAAKHEVSIVAFNQPRRVKAVAQATLALRPDIVGLGIQFQHRAHEFLGLARMLRDLGYQGHITCGGQFPTLAWREVLGRDHGVDSVVLHDGEQSFVELVAALEENGDLHRVPGLALETAGAPVRTAPRGLEDNLDELPFPKRYRAHARHMGVPFVPLMGSRGCWGSCSYCSITSFYRDGRAYGGGRTVRLRSPENVAEEMALLSHAAGEPCLFCFHDDNFLQPKPERTLARLRAIRASLDEYGVGKIGMIGKCRPETVTHELAKELRELGVIRLYVGVENASAEGAKHLNRGRQYLAVDTALDACHQAGIFVCYNLLVFEPYATLDDLGRNIQFIRDHAQHPINFCRAEPYFGTPLHLDLANQQDLGGSYLGWNYRIADDQAEVLFRMCAAAFRPRNFDPEGVANRYMGLGYAANILEHFYEERNGELARLRRRYLALTEAISLDTAMHLERALDLAGANLDFDAIERETALLGLSLAKADQNFHVRLDELFKDMRFFSASASTSGKPHRVTEKLKRAATWAQGAALRASLAVGAASAVACDGCGTVVDPVPRDAGRDAIVVDPPPADAGRDAFVVDPLPPDAGIEDAGLDVFVVDPPPPDAGMTDTGPDVFVVDPPPPDAGMLDGAANDADAGDAMTDTGPDVFVVDPPPPDAGMAAGEPKRTGRRLALIDQWRDSSPKRSIRTADLPLHDPPAVTLRSEPTDDGLRVILQTAAASLSTRWQARGTIVGDGREVIWQPEDDEDQIAVAVRTSGGVTMALLRASRGG